MRSLQFITILTFFSFATGCAQVVVIPKTKSLQDCQHIGSKLSDSELVLNYNRYRSPIVIIGTESFYCPCDSRSFGGDTETRTLKGGIENRNHSGTIEQRRMAGNTENRMLSGSTENRNIGGSQERRGLDGRTEQRRLGGNTEIRRFGGEVSKVSCFIASECRGFMIDGVRDNMLTEVFDGRLRQKLIGSCFQ